MLTKRIWSIWPQSFELPVNDLHKRCNWNRIKDEPVEFWSILLCIQLRQCWPAPRPGLYLTLPVFLSLKHKSTPLCSPQPCRNRLFFFLWTRARWLGSFSTGQLIWLFDCAGLDLLGKVLLQRERVALLDRPVCFYSSPDSEVTFWFSCLKWSSLSEKSVQELR